MSLTLIDDPILPGGVSYEYQQPFTKWIESAEGAPPGLRIVGLIDDDAADYSFDDWVLAKGEKGWYLFAAAGCSCPSHEEMARMEVGPSTLAEVREHIESGSYEGYTLPKRQREQFADLFKHAAKFDAGVAA